MLLLDDVPSELDPERRDHLFHLVGQLACQTIISVSDRGLVPALAARRDFRVASGTIFPE